MHYIRKISLLVAAVTLGLLSQTAVAQNVGNCERSTSQRFLDINNVRALIMNNGGLFWAGGQNVYEIPKGSHNNAIFASGIWVGGQVAGQLRMAATTYGPWEFWSGPLNDDGTAPADCSPWDRIWKVSKEDVVSYEATGAAIPDLADWPTGLGAPTLDAEGNLIELLDQPLASRVDRKINLGAGERPQILGDQMLWWIMNDRGNSHNNTDTPPIGLEAHGSAFAFNTAGAIGNTTFYKFRLFYRGTSPLEDAYLGIFSDPDLGAAFDDYVGSDTTLGVGYVYNADNDDDGNYGAAPPASGYDFFQGPLVDTNGVDDDGDGVVDNPGERLSMTAFAYYNNGGGVTGDPQTGPDFYNYMQGRWKDGQRFTFGGDGRSFSSIPTSFMFPGNPAQGQFWSELNSDNQGSAIAPADRRFVMSTGPFTIQPNDEQEMVFGLVTSFGADNLDSVTQMKLDDALAQAVFDIDFALPSPPAGPRVTVTENNNQVLLEWGYNPTDNNYLDSYRVIDPLLSPDVADRDYVFEGYVVYQYASTSDQDGVVLATYDVVNGVTRVIEGTELTFLTADGSDRGVQHFHVVDGLTNYTTYEFGVQAYAYNAESGQKVYAGPISRVSAVPSHTDLILSEDAISATRANAEPDVLAVSAETNIGDGSVSVNVVNASRVTGDDYRVEFYTVDTAELGKQSLVFEEEDLLLTGREANLMKPDAMLAKSSSATVVTYDVTNVTTGEKVFDGTAAVAATGVAAPEGNDVVQFDGLSMNVGGAPNDFLAFEAVANAAGPLDPPEGAAADFQGFPVPNRGGARQQVGEGVWFFHTFDNGSRGSYADFLTRSVTGRGGWGNLVPYDFEMRFTAGGGFAYNAFTSFNVVPVPFELWRTGIGTPDDPSDDVRLVPYIIDWDGDGYGIQCFDHSGSGGDNDPELDAVYWYLPADLTPGQSGYQAWEAAALALPDDDGDGNAGGPGDQQSFFGVENGGEVIGRTVLFNWNGGSVANCAAPQAWNSPNPSQTGFDQDVPETGTIIRLSTTKPNQAGDTFAFSTDGLGARAKTTEEATAALDNIGIVPNPYKGASAYEVSQLVDQVRFTNMPNTATIRVFTLSGTLIKVLEKNSAANMFPWDLTTDEGLPIASGMYIIHVETDLGEKVLKFGVVKKRVQLNNF